ncbi:hypothetical protein TNCV_1351291 [Trichonephila clavipes]|nr:hypothetical protein TNCV_1351291 [Trichonephila clavipes]
MVCRVPPDQKCVLMGMDVVRATGNVSKERIGSQKTEQAKDLLRSDKPNVRDAIVERVRQSFQRSPIKSICEASRELQIPQTSLKNEAPPPFEILSTRGFLGETFPNGWNGKKPLDISLWSYIKDSLCHNIDDIEELKENLQAAVCEL